ncbi:MAG: phosphoribosylglycinamide formyltransferase [Planctomycetales bacterium]|nr:phosphoribosylglycinamide formyltransferase [Planctomycetales bacterium]
MTAGAGRVRAVVLLSGRGTTLQNFLDLSRAGNLPLDVAGVIASREDSGGLLRAHEAGIPGALVVHADFRRDEKGFSKAVTKAVDRFEPELVLLCGFNHLWSFPARYRGRVMNVHPALLPMFGGKGFYGHRVHEAVLAAGVKITGCTVHFADGEYDRGPIILQRPVPVMEDDTPESLSARVQAAEREAYPEAVRLFAEGKLRLEGKRVRVLS